jgi:hypothetical protein
MSKFYPCKDCRGGWKDRNRTIICSTCGGSGNSKKKKQGGNYGLQSSPLGRGEFGYCVRGHKKNGTLVRSVPGSEPIIEKYCLVCTRQKQAIRVEGIIRDYFEINKK